MMAKRLLVFDIIKIVGISMIVLLHMAIPTNLNWQWVLNTDLGILPRLPGPLVFGVGGMGGWGVFLFILASGAVIEYAYGKKIRTITFSEFISKRLLRLYPAYWISILFAVAMVPALLNKDLIEWIRTISGFYVYLNPYIPFDTWTGGSIQSMGWFIGCIVGLYFFYPMTTEFLSKYREGGLFAIGILSWGMSLALLPDESISYWFPLTRLFTFALGIYLVQNELYPRWESTSLTIYLGELTFYIFLVHFTFTPILTSNIPEKIPVFIITVLIFSVLLFKIDSILHNIITRYCDTKKTQVKI